MIRDICRSFAACLVSRLSDISGGHCCVTALIVSLAVSVSDTSVRVTSVADIAALQL